MNDRTYCKKFLSYVEMERLPVQLALFAPSSPSAPQEKRASVPFVAIL